MPIIALSRKEDSNNSEVSQCMLITYVLVVPYYPL